MFIKFVADADADELYGFMVDNWYDLHVLWFFYSKTFFDYGK